MIDLRRAVIHSKGDVVHQVVVRRTELRNQFPGNQLLAGILDSVEAPCRITDEPTSAEDKPHDGCGKRENEEDRTIDLVEAPVELIASSLSRAQVL